MQKASQIRPSASPYGASVELRADGFHKPPIGSGAWGWVKRAPSNEEVPYIFLRVGEGKANQLRKMQPFFDGRVSIVEAGNAAAEWSR